MRIAHKLIIGVLLLVVMIWAVGLYAVHVGKDHLREAIVKDSSLLASEMIESVDMAVSEVTLEWLTYTAGSDFQQALADSNAEFAARPNAQAYINEQDFKWRSQQAGRTTSLMEAILNHPQSQDLKRHVAAISSVRGGEVFGEVFVTNRYGVNVMQTGRTSDYRQDDEKWWRETVKDGLFIGEAGYDESSDTFSRDVCVRIDDEKGNLLGVMKAVLSMKQVIAVLKHGVERSVGDNDQARRFHVLLMDSQRRLIFSSLDGEATAGKQEKYNHAFERFGSDRTVTFEADDPELGNAMITCAFSGDDGAHGDLGWILALEYPTDEIFAPLTSLRNQVLTTASIVTCVALAMSLWLSMSFSGRLSKLRDQAMIAGEGDFSQRLGMTESDEIGQLARSLDLMSDSLEASQGDIEQSDWLKTGQAELNVLLRGEQHIEKLAGQAIVYLAERTGAQIGAFYLVTSPEKMQLVGTYAFDTRKHLSNTIEFGQGLVGQAALEKQSILLTGAPDDYIVVSSGLGQAAPSNILVMPIIRNGQTKGVIELGSVEPFDPKVRMFLDNVAEGLAVAVDSVRARQRIEDLLEETQRQSETLQAQQEELRQSNEELEEQAETLKESEARLRAQQAELEESNQQLEEQTQALQRQRDQARTTNDQLETTRLVLEEKARDLEVTGRYKSEFLANMSHELRTPLNSLLILSRLLGDNESGNLTDKQVSFANTINDSGGDLLRLINEILDLSKIESGKMALVYESVNIKDYAGEIETQFKHVAQEKGLELILSLDEKLPQTFSSDTQRLGQVLKNLLSNAVKFTSEGSVTLAIEPAKTNASVPGIAFHVIDTGVGIPQDKQRIIFEAFQQADGTTDRLYGGTGLGLSISRELVKLFGGELRLTSIEGQGSTFSAVLPLAAPSVKPQVEPIVLSIQAPSPSAVSLSEPAVSQSRSVEVPALDVPDDRDDICADDKSILIIEDDPAFAGILAEVSREKGFKCLIAGNGESGLHLADYYLPSAALVDIGLPGMDGLSVISRLKDDLKTRHIPVHLISGTEQHIKALDIGAVGFLKKPVNMEALNEAFGTIEHFVSDSVRRLLVVEDDPEVSSLVVRLVSDQGLDVTTVQTGNQATELLANESFDCMVLDLGLPDISGIDLLRKIRQDDRTDQLPVIVLTGKELTRTERADLSELAQRIIPKGHRSPERIIDETTLFLHRLERDLPEKQRTMIHMVHDKENILRGKTVLMVDDDMRNLFALGSVLETKGLHLHMATDGENCLEALAENPEIDLVLMDIMMPQMDGYEAIKRIREMDQYKKLPIIALTAKAMQGDRAKCIEAGASDYLAKPVEVDKLLSLLRVWLYECHDESVSDKHEIDREREYRDKPVAGSDLPEVRV
jgi:CheY-like chemotaxis protein/putative methionine-R-sulfoxide reductase with GAF domain